MAGGVDVLELLWLLLHLPGVCAPGCASQEIRAHTPQAGIAAASAPADTHEHSTCQLRGVGFQGGMWYAQPTAPWTQPTASNSRR